MGTYNFIGLLNRNVTENRYFGGLETLRLNWFLRLRNIYRGIYRPRRRDNDFFNRQ